ncbi:zinc-binding dehydrogenase [Nocardioides jiangxiensis]|uniref:Zinc-binding dehydrogenase n=1 Tax=Nocardioides jiangxiensis TaxID=3064524 RepID=A0ABT9B2D7_9ACTN|nr:zinc-binding dehydrogenase [Nocardioides sp. WY-20]MDO7868897.1 zinc-binding dehydrogenase [Nocardioides sp. WY-20]
MSTMKAAVVQQGEFSVTDLPVPTPGPGQLLLRVVRAGICGSDLHARSHTADLHALGRDLGYEAIMSPAQQVVMGHEFVGELVARGPKTKRSWTTGTRVVAVPMVKHGDEIHMTGFDVDAPGAYAEYLLVQEAFAFAVPDGVDDDKAAFTEPLAVAWHAVRRGEVGRRPAIVIGCGPIGLAVILMLKASGVKTIVASDLSPTRRELARRCGATVVVDPREQSPWTAYELKGPVGSVTELADFGLSAIGAMRKVPLLPWGRVMRAGEKLGAAPAGPVVFECVGVPGILDQIFAAAPVRSRIVGVGVCMEPDTVRTTLALNKEHEIRFVFAYDPEEFQHALHLIASGKVDPSPLHTGTVGLGDLTQAFTDLGDPEAHAKILVDPSL